MTPERTPDLDTVFDDAALPEPLPDSPLPLFRAWFDKAHEKEIQPNPNAMTLATIDPDGRPSARIVLCKMLDADLGKIVFYTNRRGRKGRALAANDRVALVFHWDAFDRQVRVEGPATESPDAESDAYFQSRAWEKRLGAWASQQSEPAASRDQLMTQAAEAAMELGLDLAAIVDGHGEDLTIPRPPHWGGYRVWAESVELWSGGTGRIHDRAVWTRELKPREIDGAPGFEGGPWSSTRLQP